MRSGTDVSRLAMRSSGQTDGQDFVTSVAALTTASMGVIPSWQLYIRHANSHALRVRLTAISRSHAYALTLTTANLSS